MNFDVLQHSVNGWRGVSPPNREALARRMTRSRARGVTLIELMVTLAVAAIVLAAAIPSFTSAINSNRLTGQVNELVASLQFARSEAIRLNTNVSFCRTTNGTSCAAANGRWSAWVVVGNGAVLRSGTIREPLQVTSSQQSIGFFGDGLARSSIDGALTAASLVVCHATDKPQQNQRQLDLVSGSRVSTEVQNGGGACP